VLCDTCYGLCEDACGEWDEDRVPGLVLRATGYVKMNAGGRGLAGWLFFCVLK
jgi:hypothetical protein